MLTIELRNNCAKTWNVKTFDVLPYIRFLKAKKSTEIELGWLCFAIVLIKAPQ